MSSPRIDAEEKALLIRGAIALVPLLYLAAYMSPDPQKLYHQVMGATIAELLIAGLLAKSIFPVLLAGPLGVFCQMHAHGLALLSKRTLSMLEAPVYFSLPILLAGGVLMSMTGGRQPPEDSQAHLHP